MPIGQLDELFLSVRDMRSMRRFYVIWEGHWGAKPASFEDPEGNTIHLEEPSDVETHESPRISFLE